MKINCVTSLVPVGNRIYHQGGSGCRSHGSCLDGFEPDARLNVVGMVVGEQPLVLCIIIASLVPVWQPYAPPGGAEARTHKSCSAELSQTHIPRDVCTILEIFVLFL